MASSGWPFALEEVTYIGGEALGYTTMTRWVSSSGGITGGVNVTTYPIPPHVRIPYCFIPEFMPDRIYGNEIVLQVRFPLTNM